MIGSSRTSLIALREYLDARYADATARKGFEKAGRGLLSVVDLLDSNRALRESLGAPALAASIKQQVVSELLASQTTELALRVTLEVVDLRWSNPQDMIDALEEAAASLLFMSAEAHGTLGQVEEELFRFGRAVDASADLQMALTNPALPPAAKSGVVQSLLEDKADPITRLMLEHVCGHLRGRRAGDAITRLSELAARRHGRVLADVLAAVALTRAQEQRLRAVLSQIFGRDVELNVLVDPSVIGGIEVRVGDEVIDSTVSTRLDQARRRLAG